MKKILKQIIFMTIILFVSINISFACHDSAGNQDGTQSYEQQQSNLSSEINVTDDTPDVDTSGITTNNFYVNSNGNTNGGNINGGNNNGGNNNGGNINGGLAINNPTGNCSLTNPCKEGDFCRIKTGKCYPLVHKDWGFKGFPLSGKVINVGCGGNIEAAINKAGAGDTIKVAACTFNGRIFIRKSNIAIRGAGMGKTILNGMFDIRGAKNLIISDFTIHANGMIGGIDGYNNGGGNLLYERIEADGAGKAGNVKITKYPYNTIRYCKLSNSLHGIANKMANKSQIYSNEAFNNSNYGMDSSTVDKIEIAGNYFHNNAEAGAKTPNAKELHYHHNDMNKNGKAGIVYYRDGSNSGSEFGKNTRDQKGEVTLEYNDLTGNGDGIGFNGVWAQNTEPQMNYLILKYNKQKIFNCKKCGRIEIWGDNGQFDQPFGPEGNNVIKH